MGSPDQAPGLQAPADFHQTTQVLSMDAFLMTNEIQDNDFLTKGVEAASELPSVGTLFLGVFVTLLPKLVPRLLPMFTVDRSLDAKFDDLNYVANGEEISEKSSLKIS